MLILMLTLMLMLIVMLMLKLMLLMLMLMLILTLLGGSGTLLLSNCQLGTKASLTDASKHADQLSKGNACHLSSRGRYSCLQILDLDLTSKFFRLLYKSSPLHGGSF